MEGISMLKTVNELVLRYKDYSDPLGKIHREIKRGNLIPVVKGLYETDTHTPGHYLASSIYGPSYLSFEFALAFHGLIPERVYTYTNATYKKNRTKKYNTHFGLFTYRDIPEKAFPYGVVNHIENGYSFAIATPEKALCDRLYIAPPQTSMKQLKLLMFEDLRIEEEDFEELDPEQILILCDLYPSTNMKQLKKIIVKEGRKHDNH